MANYNARDNHSELLIDISNPVADTRKFYIDMNKFDKAGFQFILNGGSATNTMIIKLHGTLDMKEDETTNEYDDITLNTFLVSSLLCPGGTTKKAFWIDHVGKLGLFTWLMLEVVNTVPGGADQAIKIISNKMY